MPISDEPVPADWEEYARALGRRLQDARGERTQEEIAQLAKMSRPYYHGLEHGRWHGRPATPSIQVLARVSQALDVELTDLLPPARDLSWE